MLQAFGEQTMNPRLPSTLVFSFVGLFVVFSGCSSDHPDGMPTLHPCEVTVTQDGAVLADATVILHPEGAVHSWTPMGVTDAQGTAILRTLGKYGGASAGKYKITVSKTEREPSQLGPAPSENDPAYASWSRRAAEENLLEFSVVDPDFSDPQKTTLEIEVVRGSNALTVDVGKSVRIKN